MHICTQLLCQMSVKPGCWIRRELESDTLSQEGGHHWRTLNSAAQNWTTLDNSGITLGRDIEVASVINRKGIACAGSWFMTEG